MINIMLNIIKVSSRDSIIKKSVLFNIYVDPDLYAERLAAQQCYVDQLQSKYNMDAETYEEKLRKVNQQTFSLKYLYNCNIEIQKEEEKLQELHAKYADPSGSGRRLGGANSSQQSSKPKSFKPGIKLAVVHLNKLYLFFFLEYNPLMGDSSRGYRPQKKSCPGGGCGR